MKGKVLCAMAASLFLASAMPAQIMGWTSRDPQAIEAFRLGVQSFHRGNFNEAILEHEKALSAAPGDPLVLSWLARSYFRSGLESTSIERWRQASLSGGNGPFLESRMEFIASRRALVSSAPPPERLIETGRILSSRGKSKAFHRPSWILPEADGSLWVVGYGSNDLLHYDTNGIQLERFVGPLGGLDRPYAMVKRAKGGYWVSEHNSDRISALSDKGIMEARFGSSGSGPGQLLGPGALAVDDSGYLYVCDYGNRRIAKFTGGGEFVSSFGQKAPGFRGLSSPTGIAWKGASLFIADRGAKALYEFDRDGNYLGVLADAERGLEAPEGLSSAEGDLLLLTDSDRIWAIDARSQAMTLVHASQERGSRFSHAAMDANGNVLCSDFDHSFIDVLSPSSSVYSGLFVNALRIDASSFPTVRLEVLVQDARARPLTGLSRRNFHLSERIRRTEDRIEGGKVVSYAIDSLQPPLSVEFSGEMGKGPSLDCSVLFSGSPDLNAPLAASREVLGRELALLSGLGEGNWVFGSRLPSMDKGLSPASAIARRLGSKGSPDWRFDSSLRLAASALSVSGPRRAVIFVTATGVGEASFDSYSLSDLAAFMRNNGVAFVAVILGGSTSDSALEYLAAQTGGGVYALSRPEGLAPPLRTLSERRTGIYQISFESAADSQFGREYLPLSIETYVMKKSGRDEIGYFAPLR